MGGTQKAGCQRRLWFGRGVWMPHLSLTPIRPEYTGAVASLRILHK